MVIKEKIFTILIIELLRNFDVVTGTRNILIMKMIIAVNDAAGAWVVHIVMNMMHLLMRNFRKSRREKSNDDDVCWY